MRAANDFAAIKKRQDDLKVEAAVAWIENTMEADLLELLASTSIIIRRGWI